MAVPKITDAEEIIRNLFGRSQEMMREIFITGSTAFGEASEDSDIDLVFAIMSQDTVTHYLTDNGIAFRDSDYNNGIHIDVAVASGSWRVNILFLHPLDYVVWFRAGEIYKTLPRLNDRCKRHAIFETLRGVVKSAFAMSGTVADRANCLELRRIPEQTPASSPKENIALAPTTIPF